MAAPQRPRTKRRKASDARADNAATPREPPPSVAPSPRGPQAWVLVVSAMAAVAVIGLCVRSRAGDRERGPAREAAPSVERDPVDDAPDGPASPGALEATPMELAIPDGYVRPEECSPTPESWHFTSTTSAEVAATLTRAGFDAAPASEVASSARCDAGGCSVTPSPAIVEAMSRAQRSALYRELRRDAANRLQVFAYLRPDASGPWSAMPGLSPRVRELLAQGTWDLPGHTAFSDLPWLCGRLDSDADRVAALRALRVRYGLDVHVRVPTTGSLDPMVRYWRGGGTAAEVRRTLEDGRAHGGRVALRALLTPMARARLNAFPPMGAALYDCFWTAVNFFEASPVDHFPGPDGIGAMVRRDYVEVPAAEAAFGDLVALSDASDRITHTASLVAGDLLFTKNGQSRQRPWVIDRLDDVRATYPNVSSVRYWRLRARAIMARATAARPER